MTTRRIIGSTEEVTTCDLCGRSDLSHTVMIDFLDADGNREGEINYYGSECATRIYTGRTARQIEREAKQADAAKIQAERDAAREAASIKFQADHAPFYAWIKATYGVTVTNFGDIYDNSKMLGRKSPYTLKREYAAR